MANFDELDLDFELDAPLGGGGRPSELTSDPRADEWAAAATTTHRIGHVRDISLADDEEDFAAASLGSRSVAGDDVVGRARRGGPGSDVSSIEIMRGAEDRESNPLSVGGRDSDRFLGRPDDDDAGLVDLEPVGAADLAAVGADDDDEMGFAPPPLDDDDGMDAGLLGPRASGSLGAVDDLAALEAMDEDGAAAAQPDDRSGDPMDVDAAPPAAAPRPKRRRPRRAVDLADAAAALDTDTIKGWMRDRSAIVDVKRPRYDAVAAAPADPLAPRLAPAAAPELAAVVARLHGGDGASARAALPVNRRGAEAAPPVETREIRAVFPDGRRMFVCGGLTNAARATNQLHRLRDGNWRRLHLAGGWLELVDADGKIRARTESSKYQDHLRQRIARKGLWSYYEKEEWNVAPVATPKPKVAPKQRERPGSASAMASTDKATDAPVDEATTRAWIAAHYRLPPPADAGPSLADDLPADAPSADEAAAAAASPDDEPPEDDARRHAARLDEALVVGHGVEHQEPSIWRPATRATRCGPRDYVYTMTFTPSTRYSICTTASTPSTRRRNCDYGCSMA